MQKNLSFIIYCGSALLLFTRKLHCLQTFLQVTARRVFRPYGLQNFRPVPLTVFEIQGFKLKNKNDNDNDKKKKNWKNGLFAISPKLVVQL